MDSRSEYLKKYLSTTEDETKKSAKIKRKHRKDGKKSKFSSIAGSRFRIIDEDDDGKFSSFVHNDIFASKATISGRSDSKRNTNFGDDEEENDSNRSDEDGGPVVVLGDDVQDELQKMGKFKAVNWASVDPNAQKSRSRDLDPSGRIRKRHDSDSSSEGGSKRPINDDDDQDEDLEPRRRPRRDSDSSGGGSRKNDGDQSDLELKRRPYMPRPRHDSDQSAATGAPPPDSSPPRRCRKINNDRDDVTRSIKVEPGTDESNSRRQRSRDRSPRRPAGIRSEPDPFSPVRRRDQYNKDKFNRRKPKKELTEEQKKRQEEMKQNYEVWNKGTKQVQDRQAKLKELAEIAEQPMARYEGNQDLERHLKDQLLDDDPMKAYVDKRREKIGDPAGGATKRPAYKGHAPANRYGILPGYRWDGVDRSNGFEQRLLSQANQKRAEQDEYYAWSSGRFE